MPASAYTMESTYSRRDSKKFQLVFFYEFNTDGRSFYPGEDPLWEVVSLDYWATANHKLYDPAAVYTKDGSLLIKLSQHPEHGKYFCGGMLQSWNKFCFRNGLIVTSAQMPFFDRVGYDLLFGLWAIWSSRRHA